MERDPVFLTGTNLQKDDNPSKNIKNLEAIVSGVSQMSQSTLLMKKRKEMREIDDALEFMKEDYDQRMEACDERTREFERKQHEMKEQVARFEKFVRENDAKRQRAEVKAKTEHRTCEQNEIRRKQLVLQLEKDQALRESLEEKRDRLLKYRTYLDLAVEVSDDEYEEIGDILNRYATLLDANDDLKGQVKLAETEMDQLRQRLITLRRETQNQVLVQNSEIHGHQQRMESLRIQALQLDLDRERHDKISNDRSRESGQIIMSLKNLYNRCLLSMKGKVPPIKESGMETMDYLTEILKVITERIVDLDYISSKYQDYVETKALDNNNSKHSKAGAAR